MLLINVDFINLVQDKRATLLIKKILQKC